MNESADTKPEPQVTFEFVRSMQFRSVYVDGVTGGLTPSGHIHMTFFSERPPLPRRQTYKLNSDGSLGSEVPENLPREPIVRDMQVDILMTIHGAESLKNWLDHYIRNLKARMSGRTGEIKSPVIVPLVPN